MENLEISGKINERVKVMDFSIINAHFPGYAAHGGMKDKFHAALSFWTQISVMV